jgi:uncharacterized phage protein (TIGR01671 family)
MREIKFRAFVGGKIFYNIAVDNKGKAMYFDSADGPLSGSFDTPGWIDFDYDGIVMQFTGLRDNNGKEIYEGDIVKGNTHRAGRIIRAKVVWHYDKWAAISLISGVYFCDGPFWDQLAVIGNAYENPELLKQGPE